MRIAVYGNLANSAYIQARLLRREGHDVELVIDPLEHFAMSDPRWEDLEFELPAPELGGGSLPDVTSPEWVRDDARNDKSTWSRRRNIAAAAARHPSALMSAWRTAGRSGLLYAGAYARVVDRLSRYDCAIAYGVGPIVAGLAGIPFVTQPFGGDITIVPFADGDGWQGQSEPGTRPPDGPEPYIAALQRYGLRVTNRILVCDPYFAEYIARLGLAHKSVEFGVPIDTEMYSPAAESELRSEFLQGREGTIVFVPSRQDWYWKGSDRMLEGFAAAAQQREDVVLVCAGWGTDLERSRRLIGELGIGNRVTLLRHAMSKPRLLRHYRAADIIMDQFTLGSYGGSSLEAMSCARPLLMYLEPERFESRSDGMPPIVNVRQPREIASALADLIDDPEKRAKIGAAERAWVVDHHGPILVRRAAELCAEAISEGCHG